MRPHLAGALARGWQVVGVGDNAPVDFRIFETHANYHYLLLAEASDVIHMLAALNAEIKRRLNALYRAGAST